MKVYLAVWCTAVLGSITAVSLIGYSDLLGAGVFALILFISLCSPAAVRACRRGLRSVRRPSAPRLEALTRAFYYADLGCLTIPSQPPESCGLTDEQLSRGWQASSRTLRRRISPAQKRLVVEERQTYLDEFEGRNPSGFAAWLTSGSGAADDLMPYLRNDGDEHDSINWDELTRRRD